MKEQFYHHCFALDQVENGDKVPVGGGFIGSKDMPYSVEADFETFFDRVSGPADTYLQTLRKDESRNFFAQTYAGVPYDFATVAQAFSGVIEGKRKNQSTNEFARSTLYRNHPDQTPKLSEIFKANHAMCVEFALLAKRYLDSHGIKSQLMSGEFIQRLNDDGVNFPDPHTFLLVEAEGKEFVYDPTIPVLNDQGTALASILVPAVSFRSVSERLKSEPTMIACKNLASGSTRYYGVGDMANVLPENLISRPEDPALSG
ncbi:MAG: hypothetical protein KA099_02820 [Alphaproteobacteria bacterium]|nr:hypothetical protein [Alphaproteobacteria bacterium]MBP7759559.1 hypothetical protein [Alphaproteobacteria bacterium]MBP7762956.1 hypothetical protein [Alphaproteobacteria bacterium]MBP7904235.1 hypothetical protein [Alphaproteobacteria bacterium]